MLRGALTILLLLGSAAQARAWRGLTCGTSTEDEVRAALGPPTERKARGPDTVLVFTRSVSGTRQVQVRVDARQVVTRIDVFPDVLLDRRAIESAYGPPCDSLKPPDTQSCYQVRGPDAGRAYFSYARDGLAVFFSRDSGNVDSLAFIVPVKATTAPPRARDAGAPEPASAPVDDGWNVEVASPSEADGGVMASLPPPPTRSAFELGGLVAGRLFLAPNPAQTPPPNRAEVMAHFDATLRLGDARAFARALLRKDFADANRDRVDVDEGWVAWDSAHFKFSAGRQRVTWGPATLFNPTDVINPVDLRDLAVPDKLGAWMVRAAVTAGPVSLEATFLPVVETHLLPPITGVAGDGRFLSPSPWVRGGLTVPEVPVPLEFTLPPPPSPVVRFDRPQAAVRLSASFLGVDLEVAYAFLYEKVPTVRSTLVLAEPPTSATVNLDLYYPRVHVFSAGAERAFGRLHVVAEGAIFKLHQAIPESPEDTFATYDVGFDLIWAELLGDNTLSLFLEFTDTRPLRGGLRTDALGLLRYPFRHSLLARASWAFGELVTIEVTSIVILNPTPDAFLTPRVQVKLADGIKLVLGASLFLGDRAGFFGRFWDNTRGEATLEAKF